MAVTVTPRPWVQATSGKVSVNRRATLRGVSVEPSSFTLAPGRSASHGDADGGAVRRPALRRARGHRPADRRGHAQGHRARLPAARHDPDPPVLAEVSLTAGTPKATKGTAVVPVRNNGNTLDPVTRQRSRSGARAARAPVGPGRADPARQVGQHPGRHQARARQLHGHAAAHPAQPDGALGHQEVHGPMIVDESRPICGPGGYARLRWSPPGLGGALRFRRSGVGSVGGQEANAGREEMKLRTILAATAISAVAAPAAWAQTPARSRAAPRSAAWCSASSS